MNTHRIGQKVRQVRLERGVRQTALARKLGISAAYLNLLEKGRRPIQLPLLLRALEALEVDVEGFMASVGEGRPHDLLAHLLDDPLARTLDLEEADLAALRAEPRLSSTVAALYHLYKNTRAELERERSRLETIPTAAPLGYAPGDEVADFLELHRNYFPELEELASAVCLTPRSSRTCRTF